jgi:hypothetical protein
LLASNETTLGALYYGQVKIREAMREYDACEQRRQQMAARNPTPGNRLNAASAAQNLLVCGSSSETWIRRAAFLNGPV